MAERVYGILDLAMRSMTVKEAKSSFARMLETANREGVMLREGDKD